MSGLRDSSRESPTPRTDAISAQGSAGRDEYSYLARTLERELAERNAQVSFGREQTAISRREVATLRAALEDVIRDAEPRTADGATVESLRFRIRAIVGRARAALGAASPTNNQE